MGVVVCRDNNRLCGYLGASKLEFNQPFPIPAMMINRFADINYKGKSISSYCPFIASPMCIDLQYRGQGIYLGLCQKILEYLPSQYDLAVTLIAHENKRSFTATSDFGFQVVDQFAVNNQDFWILACLLQEFRQLNFLVK